MEKNIFMKKVIEGAVSILIPCTLLLITLRLMTGCADLEPVDYSEINPSNFPATEADIEAGVMSCYYPLRGSWWDGIFTPSERGVMFVNDMKTRYLWIQADGDFLKVITRSYSDDITDNAYKYATNGDYYSCASKVFEQITKLLNGHKIARPMRYISNALFALLLSFLINFMVVSRASKIQNTSGAEMISGAKKMLRYTPPTLIKTGETKTYSPQSSGSGGGGSHRSGGGGHRSGGGHHGGGGGHRF